MWNLRRGPYIIGLALSLTSLSLIQAQYSPLTSTLPHAYPQQNIPTAAWSNYLGPLPPGSQVVGVVTAGQLSSAARSAAISTQRAGTPVSGTLVPMPANKSSASVLPPGEMATPPSSSLTTPLQMSAAPCSDNPYPTPMSSSDPFERPSTDGNWRIIANGGITLLQMNVPNREAFRTITFNSNTADLPTSSTTAFTHRNFNSSVIISPQAWLGFVSPEGLGVRGRYWYFSETNGQSVINDDSNGSRFAVESALPEPFVIISSASNGTGGGALAAGVGPDTITAGYLTELHSGDLEAIVVSQSDAWKLLGGVGVRYVNLRQRYDVSRTNPGGSPTTGITFSIDRETSISEHHFDGVGPTLGGEFHRSICGSSLGFYGTARGSLLIGQHRLNMTTERRFRADILGGLIDNSDRYTNARTVNDVIPIGEIEIGLQYVRDLGHCNLMLRAGFQCQTWLDAGTATTTTGDLDFFGGSFLFGLQF